MTRSPEVRATGIEPVSHAWEARVLPLNDARRCGRILMEKERRVKLKVKKLEKDDKKIRLRLPNGWRCAMVQGEKAGIA